MHFDDETPEIYTRLADPILAVSTNHLEIELW